MATLICMCRMEGVGVVSHRKNGECDMWVEWREKNGGKRMAWKERVEKMGLEEMGPKRVLESHGMSCSLKKTCQHRMSTFV